MGMDDCRSIVVAGDPDDYSDFVDCARGRPPGATSTGANLSLWERKASNKLPVSVS